MLKCIHMFTSHRKTHHPWFDLHKYTCNYISKLTFDLNQKYSRNDKQSGGWSWKPFLLDCQSLMVQQMKIMVKPFHFSVICQ